jgi:hypothetical protein
MLTNESLITIYNENKGRVYAEGLMERQYIYEAMQDDIPSETLMPLSDIKHINSRSSIFRDGIIRVESEKEDEVFKICGISKKFENYLNTDEIQEIILQPTAEKLQKFLEVTSPVSMDKIRNVLVELNNSDEYDISVRVFDVINGRMDEINRGKRKSEIIIKKKKNEIEEKNEPVKEKKTGNKKDTSIANE